MNPTLPDEALELGETATRAFTDLGGVDVARRAEGDPDLRRRDLEPVLNLLGLADLDPRDGGVALAAGAAWCEAAGRVALPYPLAAALVRDPEGRPTAVIARGRPRVDHAGLFDAWRVGTLDASGAMGTGGVAHPVGQPLASRLGPFVGDLEIEEGDPPSHRDLLIQQALLSWTVLGTLAQALAVTTDHVNGRVQFGKPIAAFQAVQFQLADAAVAVAGLRELATFTLWRIDEAGAGATADVLGLRLHALEVARAVLRSCQQLHGAAGVCDEYDISVLARMIQPALRLPSGVEQVVGQLAEAIATDGFVGLFPHGGVG